LFATVPASVGQLSSLSKTPSLSPSFQGHPLFATGPASFGHASCAFAKPSASASGQPANDFNPA